MMGTATSGALNVVPPGCPMNVSAIVIASGGIGKPEPGAGAADVRVPSSFTTCGVYGSGSGLPITYGNAC